MGLKFGTDGWRAIIAREFTFTNVRRVAAGIAEVISPAAAGGSPVVVIGHDTRFLSRRFAVAAAESFLARGWRVRLADGPSPTPAVSCACVDWRATAGVVITASHNPAPFNGVKIKVATGASAPDQLTHRVESAVPDSEPPGLDLEEGRRRGLFETVSLEGPHIAWLSRMVDLAALRGAGLNVLIDAMHGSAGNLLERILAGGATRVRTIHSNPDPLFGGLHPEPVEGNLQALRNEAGRTSADASFAVDGDGDRIGAFDDRGAFVSPLRIAPLLAWSLIRAGRRGPLGKTFANTILLDRIAARHGLPMKTFPVGFKHIARELEGGRMLLAGEESGGIGVAGFVPERDGTLIGLMLLQAMHDTGRSLSGLLADMAAEFGTLQYRRIDVPCPPDRGRLLVERLSHHSPSVIGGMPVTATDSLDGLKLLLGDDGWVLFRPSGTEPLLRIYSEAPTQELLDAVMKQAVDLVES